MSTEPKIEQKIKQVATKEKVTPQATSHPEQEKTPSNFWMARLYTASRQAEMARTEEEHTENIIHDYEKRDAYKATELGLEAEKKFMSKPDFNERGRKSNEYQAVVEQFAMIVGTDLLLRNDYFGKGLPKSGKLNHEWTSADIAASAQSLGENAAKFQEMADKIKSEHNSPKEKVDYAVFALRSFFREFKKELEMKDAKISSGVVQLFKETEELAKDMGKYRVNGGNVETISRLDALGQRKVWEVTPVSPTKPFATASPEDSVSSIFLTGEMVKKDSTP